MKRLSDGARDVRATRPLIHCIANYVTADDCASVLSAIGASPMMADAEEEVEEIVARSSGLNLNLGTLNDATIRSMFLAGKKANELGIPVTLDPVGVGVSNLRTKTTRRLLEEVRFAAIRGNASEINVLAQGVGEPRGVDVREDDAVNGANWLEYGKKLRPFARKLNAVVVASGEVDVLTDGVQIAGVFNGSPQASRIVGAGCMLTSVLCAWLAARRRKRGSDDLTLLETAVSATAFFGICGEIAAQKTKERGGGTATFRNELIDAASTLETTQIDECARVEFTQFA